MIYILTIVQLARYSSSPTILRESFIKQILPPQITDYKIYLLG